MTWRFRATTVVLRYVDPNAASLNAFARPAIRYTAA